MTMDVFLLLLMACMAPGEALPLAATYFRVLVPGSLKEANHKPDPPVPKGQGA